MAAAKRVCRAITRLRHHEARRIAFTAPVGQKQPLGDSQLAKRLHCADEQVRGAVLLLFRRNGLCDRAGARTIARR
jgi:hypothetical protein